MWRQSDPPLRKVTEIKQKFYLSNVTLSYKTSDSFPSFSEVECWAHAAASLQALSKLSLAAMKEDTVGKVNRLFLAWPADEELPTGGIDEVNDLHKKLKNGLAEIKVDAEREIKYGIRES